MPKGTCVAAECGRPNYVRGYCTMHYQRVLARGTPYFEYDRRRTRDEVVASLENRIDRNADGCWLWIGKLNHNGYGVASYNGRSRLAHRLVYEMYRDVIPQGLTLDHLCRKPACVNPDHLEPVTASENTRRAAQAKTHCKRGHPFSGENIRVLSNGHRTCQICWDMHQARHAELRKARSRKGCAHNPSEVL